MSCGSDIITKMPDGVVEHKKPLSGMIAFILLYVKCLFVAFERDAGFYRLPKDFYSS